MAVIVLGLATCVVLALVLVDLGRQVAADSPRAERVLEDFMIAMAHRDTQTAYALFSTRAKKQVPISNLEKMVQGSSYCLFDGFQDIEIESFVFNATFNNNSNEPQGVTARVEGTISYEGHLTGTLNAILEQEDDEYRLVNVTVRVPPEKLDWRSD